MSDLGINEIGSEREERIDPLALDGVELDAQEAEITAPETLTPTIQDFASEWAAQGPEEAMSLFNNLKKEIYEAFGVVENSPNPIDVNIQTRLDALEEAVRSNDVQEIANSVDSLFDGAIDSPERLNQLAGLMLGQGGGNFEGLSIGGKNPLSEEQLRNKRESERAQNIAIAAATTEAMMAMDRYNFTPQELAAAFNVINAGLTQADRKYQNEVIDANTDGHITSTDAADMQTVIDRQIEIMRENPAMAGYSEDQLRALAELYTAEAIMEEKGVTREVAEGILRESYEVFQAMSPDEQTAALTLAISSAMAYKNTQLTQQNAANTLNAASTLNTQALELTETMKRDMIVTLDYDLGGGEAFRTPVYVGYGIAEDGRSIITEGEGPVQYFTSYDDGTFQPINLQYAIAAENDQGAKLADQIEGSGFNIDMMEAELRQYLLEDLGVSTQEDLLNYLRTDPNSHPAVGILMSDEAFVNTVGNYALAQEIQAELDSGQVFANDPALDDLILNKLSEQGWTTEFREERKELLQNLVDTLEELEAQKASLELDAANPLFGSAFQTEIAEIDEQITAIQSQLEETRQALIVELDDANAWYEKELRGMEQYAEQNPDFPVPVGGGTGSTIDFIYSSGQNVNQAYAAQQHATELLQIVSDSLGVEMPEPPASEAVASADASLDSDVAEETTWDRSRYNYLEDGASALVDEILASSEPISVEQMEAMVRHDQLLGAYSENGLLMVQAILEEKSPTYEFSDAPLPAHYVELNVAKDIYNDMSLESISKEEIMNRLSDAGLNGEQLAASTEQIIADLQTDIGMDFVTDLNYPDDNANMVYGQDHTAPTEDDASPDIADNQTPNGPQQGQEYEYTQNNSTGPGMLT